MLAAISIATQAYDFVTNLKQWLKLIQIILCTVMIVVILMELLWKQKYLMVGGYTKHVDLFSYIIIFTRRLVMKKKSIECLKKTM